MTVSRSRPTLPETGTYTFKLDPRHTTTGSLTVRVWEIPADVDAGSLSIDGPAKTLSTTVAGQNATATFTGTQGQRIQLQTSGSTYSQFPDWAVTRPNGQVWSSGYGSFTTDVATLPETGTYTFKLDPRDTTTGSLTVRAFEVPADPADVDAGSFSIDGATKTLSTTVAGQNATATFTGTQRQRIQLQTSGSTYSQFPDWAVTRPNGQVWSSGYGSFTTDVATLPETGTYTFKLDPRDTTTGSIIVRAFEVPAE